MGTLKFILGENMPPCKVRGDYQSQRGFTVEFTYHIPTGEIWESNPSHNECEWKAWSVVSPPVGKFVFHFQWLKSLICWCTRWILIKYTDVICIKSIWRLLSNGFTVLILAYLYWMIFPYVAFPSMLYIWLFVKHVNNFVFFTPSVGVNMYYRLL